MILNNIIIIIIMFNLMKWKFIYIQMNNEKKKYRNYTIRKTSELEKNIYIQRNGLTKKEDNER